MTPLSLPRCLERAALVLVLLTPPAALAAEPVRHVGIHVQPYYAAADSPDAAPTVAVGASYSELLASTRREDILAVRDKIAADPALVTPMTMMVLAIRLYDVGLRDDAAFWFYAAKDRYLILADVVDIDRAGLAQVEDAVRNFVVLGGPFFNGYAFCDIANQQAIRQKALAWGEEHPYAAMFMTRLPARPGGRDENHLRSLARLKADAEKERAYFDDPAKLAEFLATRKKNEMDAKFCWQ